MNLNPLLLDGFTDCKVNCAALTVFAIDCRSQKEYGVQERFLEFASDCRLSWHVFLNGGSSEVRDGRCRSILP